MSLYCLLLQEIDLEGVRRCYMLKGSPGGVLVMTGALKVMLDEVHTVRVHTISAHLMTDSQGMGTFLHATLQELRVLTDFRDKMIENHHLVRASMVAHLFNTYVPKSELDLTKSSNTSLEIKCNEIEGLLKSHRKLIETNSTNVGNVKRDLNGYQKK